MPPGVARPHAERAGRRAHRSPHRHVIATRPRGTRRLGQLRRRSRRHRRRSRSRPRPARRADRSQRRRQDDLYRRDHRLRPLTGTSRGRRAEYHRTAPACTGTQRTRADMAIDRALRRLDGAREPARRLPSPVGVADDPGDRLSSRRGLRRGRPGTGAARARALRRRATRASCRKGSASSSGSRARSSQSRGWSAWTSRPPVSTPTRASSWGSACARSGTAARPYSSSTTIWGSYSGSATRFSCSSSVR